MGLCILYFVKLARVMMLWIALYLTEKLFQDAYVQKVWLQEDSPPSLLPLAPIALGMEAVGFAVMVAVLVLVRMWCKRPDNTFIIDASLIRKVVADYVGSLPALLAMGILLALVVQQKRTLRYADDGVRGIRALAGMLLAMYAVLLAMPFFSF